MKATSYLISRLTVLSVVAVVLMGIHPGEKRKRQPLHSSSLRFVYREFEGTHEIVCSHRLLSKESPYDWKVECFRAQTKFAQYTAHVALSQYDLTGSTKLSIELLYWLTGTRLPNEVGSTTWFHFAEKSPLQGISSSQTVDGGTAGLYLEIGSGAFRLLRRAR